MCRNNGLPGEDITLKRILCAGRLALVAQAASAEEVIGLAIGDATLRTPLPAGYVRASEAMPVHFASAAAALPPALRLVEMFVAEADLKPMLLGHTPVQPYLQVQSIRDAEQVRFTTEEWTAFQPTLARQFMGLDLDQTTQDMQAGMSERMSAVTGNRIEVTYGEVGKPTIYAQHPTSMHYSLRLPITAQINGTTRTLELEGVGAVLLAGGKIVLINAYAPASSGQPPFAAARTMTEPFVTRMQAMNPSPVAARRD